MTSDSRASHHHNGWLLVLIVSIYLLSYLVIRGTGVLYCNESTLGFGRATSHHQNASGERITVFGSYIYPHIKGPAAFRYVYMPLLLIEEKAIGPYEGWDGDYSD